MNIIITGASSFIGRAAAAELEKRGYRIFAYRHSLNELSREELDSLHNELSGDASVLLHFAWAGVGSAGRSDAAIQDYNVAMSMQTLELAAELGVGRFIFAGSQAEYGRPDEGVYLQSEDNVCHPVSEYGRAKLEFGNAGAKYCRVYNETHEGGIKFIHTRIFSIYGNGDHETSLVNTCISSFTENRPMDFGPAVQDWSYMHISDAVRAIALLCEYSFEDNSHLIINIAGADIRPLREYIERMAELCGSDSRRSYGVLPDRAEGNVSLRPDISRLKALSFEEQLSFDEGIRGLIEGVNK